MNLYETLGITPDATPEQIKAAFRTRANDTHPDCPWGNAEEFRQVKEAYDVLKDPKRRSTYDPTGSTAKQDQNNAEQQLVKERN